MILCSMKVSLCFLFSFMAGCPLPSPITIRLKPSVRTPFSHPCSTHKFGRTLIELNKNRLWYFAFGIFFFYVFRMEDRPYFAPHYVIGLWFAFLVSIYVLPCDNLVHPNFVRCSLLIINESACFGGWNLGITFIEMCNISPLSLFCKMHFQNSRQCFQN